MLNPLPHPPHVFASEMVFRLPLVNHHGLFDASFQVGSGRTVLCPIARQESGVSVCQQDMDFLCHP